MPLTSNFFPLTLSLKHFQRYVRHRVNTIVKASEHVSLVKCFHLQLLTSPLSFLLKNCVTFNTDWHSVVQLVQRNHLGNWKFSTSLNSAHGKTTSGIFVKQPKVLFRIDIYQSPSYSNTNYTNPQCTIQESVVKECFISKMSIAQFNLLLKDGGDTLN